MIKIIFALTLSANAGIISNICQKCLSLVVMDDPYEFETVSTSYLIDSFKHLAVAKRWRGLNQFEQSGYDRLKKEIEHRRYVGSDEDRNLIDETLIRFVD